jgi:hypothetical protein
MPIPVKCQCGAAFAAKDELAGKRVQCPKCKNPLAIPAPQVAAADDDDYRLEAPIEAPKPTVSIFDQAGMTAMAPGMKPCPNCEAPMSEEAVLCVKCGYHAATGKVITGHKSVNKSHGGDAHSVVADSMLEKARESIEEDKESKEKETQEGMPWYVMLPIFLFFLLFLGMMLTLPNDMAFFYAGVIFIIAGVIGVIYFGINVFMRAFEESLIQGLLSLLPPYTVIYIIMRWEQCGVFLVNILMMFGAILLGAGLIFISPWLKPEEKKDEDEAAVHRPKIECIAEEKRCFSQPVTYAARRDIGTIAGSSSKLTNSRTA